MTTPPGDQSTQRVLEALRARGAKIEALPDGSIWCDERSTVKAMGVLRCRGRNLAEVKRRLAEMPRWCLGTHEGCDQIWLVDETWEIPDGAMIYCHEDGVPYTLIEWRHLAVQLGVFSPLPAMDEWVDWLCGEVMPAMFRHGCYDPATNHEPPPSQLLDAIERREEGRDLLNTMAPGLGDWFARPAS